MARAWIEYAVFYFKVMCGLHRFFLSIFFCNKMAGVGYLCIRVAYDCKQVSLLVNN